MRDRIIIGKRKRSFLSIRSEVAATCFKNPISIFIPYDSYIVEYYPGPIWNDSSIVDYDEDKFIEYFARIVIHEHVHGLISTIIAKKEYSHYAEEVIAHRLAGTDDGTYDYSGYPKTKIDFKKYSMNKFINDLIHFYYRLWFKEQ